MASFLHHSQGATTPTLFFIGNPELGGVDKYHTMNQLHESIRNQGIETEIIYYPDEGHAVEKAENKRDLLTRSMEFIDKNIK